MSVVLPVQLRSVNFGIKLLSTTLKWIDCEVIVRAGVKVLILDFDDERAIDGGGWDRMSPISSFALKK